MNGTQGSAEDLYAQVCAGLDNKKAWLSRYESQGLLAPNLLQEMGEAIAQAHGQAAQAREAGDTQALEEMTRKWPVPRDVSTPAEAPEMFDALVDRAAELLRERGEPVARGVLEAELRESLQDDRERIGTIVAVAVEGAVRQARRILRERRGMAAARKERAST